MEVIQREVDLNALEERFKQYLYANRGKVTRERLKLLRAFYTNDGHYSVDEISEVMRRENISISRSTIYRTLDLLVDSGLVRRLVFEGQETRFEAALNTEHHDHIICMDCNKIIEFFNQKLEDIQNDILETYNLKPVKHVHQLYGKCQIENCPEKKRPQTEGWAI